MNRIVATAGHGFICKRCGGPSPVGVGYVADGSAAADQSAGLAACLCGYSQTTPGGGEVSAGKVGLRLVGGVELVGEPADLAELGQRMATRWMSPLVSAVQDWADAVERLTDSTLPGGLTCGEADLFARLLAVAGYADAAAEFLFGHAHFDERHDDGGEDDHFYIRDAVLAAEFAASVVDLATDYGPARKLAAGHVAALLGHRCDDA